MNVNIKRARLIEFDWPDYQGQPTTPRITAMRNARGDAFDFLAIDGVVVGDEYSDCICEGDLAARAKNIVVFAEFPLSLADLLPEGCTRFEFNDGVLGTAYYARRFHEDPHHYRDDLWNVTAIVGDAGGAFKLGDLARRFDIDLDTVMPLTPHPDWVEAQR